MVVRHGRTTWNAGGRFQGHADPPLDTTGVAQAAAAAQELTGLPVVSVTSSDLRRALATAEVVGAAHGLPVTVDPALREVDLGAWEGLTPADAETLFPHEWRRWAAGEDVARGGGETRAEAGRRAAPALFAAAAAAAAAPGRPGGAVAVVVAHGYVLQAALGALAAAGAVAPFPAGAPHLGNGEWLEVTLRLHRGR
jgi:broad specificity phosphatase PhoE